MEPPAFVRFRHVRQVMRRLDGENLEYFHALPVCTDCRSLLCFLRVSRRLSCDFEAATIRADIDANPWPLRICLC